VNYTDFTRLVYDMRRSQKVFMDKRTRTALELMRALEKRVDREVLQVLGDAIGAEQPGLFESNGGER